MKLHGNVDRPDSRRGPLSTATLIASLRAVHTETLGAASGWKFDVS